jgi:Glycosyl hydrolases family 43
MYSVKRSLNVPAFAGLMTSLVLACSQSPGDGARVGGDGTSSGSSSGGGSSSGSTASSSGSGSSSGSSGSSGGSAATGDADAIVDAAVVDAASVGDAGAAASGCGPSNAGDAGDVIATINNTGPWNDTSGTHIQAHGGGFIEVCGTWYWFGEDKTLNTNGTGNFHAISCYASKDLVHWEHRNKVVTTTTASVLNNTSLIIERPKVIYNASTHLYVMWAHWDMESCPGGSGGYCDSEAVVFTSPTVDGNYTYVGHFQPGGDGSRDCALWQEPDGTAYFISTGGPGGNAAGDFHDTEVYELSSDYLTVKNTTKIWPADTREAYAFWKVNGTYYGVSSGQTGWAPNQAAYLSSTGSIVGPWNNTFAPLGNGTSTWSSQPTYVIPIVGSQTTTYVYAGDIWNSNNLSLSTYLWLPLTFDGTAWHLSYSAQWSINLATGVVN